MIKGLVALNSLKSMACIEAGPQNKYITYAKEMEHNEMVEEKYNIIEKELKVLEMLKKKMTIETDYYDSDVGCEKYEYIAYNGTPLNIDTPEEFDLLREVLCNDK